MMDGQHYRFVVKCDRAFNARVERAARAAGVTTTTFVQQHFETILGPVDCTAAAQDRTVNRDPARPPARVAPAARAAILAALRGAVSADGEIAMTYRELSALCHVSYETVRRGITELVQDGMVAVIRASSRGNTSVYRLTDGGE